VKICEDKNELKAKDEMNPFRPRSVVTQWI
jgi:hypothetical protein